MAEQIVQTGPEKVVITGIPQKTYVSNLCYEKGKGYEMIRTHKVGHSRCVRDDIFSAIIAADAVMVWNYKICPKGIRIYKEVHTKVN